MQFDLAAAKNTEHFHVRIHYDDVQPRNIVINRLRQKIVSSLRIGKKIVFSFPEHIFKLLQHRLGQQRDEQNEKKI